MNDADLIDALFQQAAEGATVDLTDTLRAHPHLADSTNQQGVSLLFWAMYHRQREAAEQIYRFIDQPDILAAAAMGDVDRLRILLDKNESLLNARSVDGFTPLHYACFFGNAACATLLIERGAQINTPADNPSGVFPLHSAAACQSTAIVKLLLDNGADPNVQQQGGYTALMSAAMHGNDEMVQLLIAAGASVELTDDDGRTAYDHGKEKGFGAESIKPKIN